MKFDIEVEFLDWFVDVVFGASDDAFRRSGRYGGWIGKMV